MVRTVRSSECDAGAMMRIINPPPGCPRVCPCATDALHVSPCWMRAILAEAGPKVGLLKRGYGSQHAIRDRLHLGDLLLRGRPIRRLGDDPHDWLGVAGAGVNPRAVPVDADAVLRVDLLAREFHLDRLDCSIRVLSPALEFRLHDLVARQIRNELADAL